MDASARLLIAATLLAGCVACAHTAFAEDPGEVWWGNRAISFRNYMKFDLVEAPAPAPEPAAPMPPPTFETIYFDLDMSVLKPEGIRIAQQVADYLRENPDKTVLVEGHCCDLATNEYNMALGQRRADAVKAYLIGQGINVSRIETVSYGEEQRVTTDLAARPLNRRAEVIVKVSEGM